MGGSSSRQEEVVIAQTAPSQNVLSITHLELYGMTVAALITIVVCLGLCYYCLVMRPKHFRSLIRSELREVRGVRPHYCR